jgi:hypothetical protein
VPPRTKVGAEDSNDGTSDSAVPRLSLTPTNTNTNTNAGRSQHIPLPSSHVHRTQSELQLCEDMAVAEHRDVSMFYRLVHGIRDKQMILDQSQEAPVSDPFIKSKESDRTIASLIHTRHQPIVSRSTRALDTIPSVQEHAVYTQPFPAVTAPPMRTAPSGLGQDPHYVVSEALDSGVADDWSVSGFEEQLSSQPPVHQQQQQYQQYQYQASPPGFVYANTDEEDEIFTLDM